MFYFDNKKTQAALDFFLSSAGMLFTVLAILSILNFIFFWAWVLLS